MKATALIAVVMWVLLGSSGPAAAQLPIFDAHIHYSRPDWSVYTPERASTLATTS